MNNLHVKTGDTAVVLSGKEKGKRGKVLSVNPKKGMVVIEGVNMIKCHTKPRRQGETGGIIEREGALRACKVMRVCPKCDKPTRVAHKITENGTKLTVCKHCGETLYEEEVAINGSEYESKVYCGSCACSDEEVSVRERNADSEARQDRNQRRLR